MAGTSSADAPRLTPAMGSRALLVLDFIRQYVARWGHPPSQREIANGLEVCRGTVRGALRRLHRDGLLASYSGERGIVLADELAQARALLERSGFAVAPAGEVLLPPPALDYDPSDRRAA